MSQDRFEVSRREVLRGAGVAAILGATVPALGEEEPGQPGIRRFGPDAVPVAYEINGKRVAINVEPRVTLLDALRDRIGLTLQRSDDFLQRQFFELRQAESEHGCCERYLSESGTCATRTRNIAERGGPLVRLLGAHAIHGFTFDERAEAIPCRFEFVEARAFSFRFELPLDRVARVSSSV